MQKQPKFDMVLTFFRARKWTKQVIVVFTNYVN